MHEPLLLMKPSPNATRLLLTADQTEVMRAVLPAARAAHPRAANTLLEGLSLWLQRPLLVALCAGAEEIWSAMGLCDGFGLGEKTLHYEVELVDPGQKRRPMGSFRDLHRLQLELRGLS